MRNWPYAWALGNGADSPVKGKFGVVALPKGGADGKHTGDARRLAARGLQILEEPGAAADLVKYLTSHEEQKRRAIEGSYNPTIAALYEDPEVLAGRARSSARSTTTFINAVARPSRVTGAKYNQVSDRVLQRRARGAGGKATARQPRRRSRRSSTGSRAADAGSRRPRGGPRHGSARRCRRAHATRRPPPASLPRSAAPAAAIATDPRARSVGLAVPGADAGRAGAGRRLAAAAHDLVRLHRRQSGRPRGGQFIGFDNYLAMRRWPDPRSGGTRSATRSCFALISVSIETVLGIDHRAGAQRPFPRAAASCAPPC